MVLLLADRPLLPAFFGYLRITTDLFCYLALVTGLFFYKSLTFGLFCYPGRATKTFYSTGLVTGFYYLGLATGLPAIQALLSGFSYNLGLLLALFFPALLGEDTEETHVQFTFWLRICSLQSAHFS